MSTINRNIRELSKVTHCNFMFFTIRLMAIEEVFASKLQIFDKLLSFLLPILDLSPIVSFFNAPMIVHKSRVVNQKNLTKMWSRINTYYSESQFFEQSNDIFCAIACDIVECKQIINHASIEMKYMYYWYQNYKGKLQIFVIQ